MRPPMPQSRMVSQELAQDTRQDGLHLTERGFEMRSLNGSELAGFIKERQAGQVRALRQAGHIQPKLAIVLTVDHPAIEIYMRMKKKYGADILVDVDIHRISQADAPSIIDQLNKDDTVHGIIVQLPLE